MGYDGSQIKRNRQKDITAKVASETGGDFTRCKVCLKDISKNAESCPNCGEPLKMKQTTISTGSSFDLGRIAGLAGAAIMSIGVFCPIVSGPIVGSMNYFRNGEGDGVFLLALAAVTVFSIIINKMRLLWYTGAASILLLCYTFYEFKSRMNSITAEMDKDLAGNPFRGLADVAINAFSIQWGIAILALGAILIIAAAAMAKETS